MLSKTRSTSDTLKVLETTEANLAKAERLWAEIRKRIPDGIDFSANPDYEDLRRRYCDVVSGLPAIDGFRLADETLDLKAIAQWRLDAMEIGEIEAQVSAAEAVDEPGRMLATYRYRLDRKRRMLIRDAVTALIRQVDETLATLPPQGDDDARRENGSEPQLTTLRDAAGQIDTLLGSSVQRPARWRDLRRHLSFGMRGDLDDVRRIDWPNVKPSLESSLYGEDEAIPVGVADLGELVSPVPRSPVPTALNWERLSADEFERLIFSLLTGDAAYENVQWVMKTSAPDRGRDISAYRVSRDGLSGTRRERLIVQCKHWMSHSIGIQELATLMAQVRLWEPPRVDQLILATSGHFAQDAVQYIERHNLSESALRVDMWPSSHLELLLAARPGIIGEFNLRD
jgi:hypothetical protein